jgi:hypothetical protein
MPINAIFLACAIAALPVALVLIAYRIWLYRPMRIHFGEDLSGRRDYKAIRRRKRFERRFELALGALYFSVIAAFEKGILEASAFADLAWICTTAQIVCLIIAFACGYGAYWCWRNPDHD